MLKSIVRVAASFLVAVSFSSFVNTARADVTVSNFSDIQYWVGSGSNEAALAIDWNNIGGSTTYVWGYRWDGAATGQDMFNAIVNDDSRLEAAFEFGGSFVYGIAYDVDADGGSFTFTPSGTETGSASDGDDYFHEGLFVQGFWGYYLRENSSSSWLESGVGFGDSTSLANGKWNGFSWSTDLTDFTSAAPNPGIAAVPEPEGWILLLGALVVVWRSRYHLRRLT